MSTLVRRAAGTAAATVIGVSLLIAAKSGPGATPAALRQPGVIGRAPAAPAPKLPVAGAPPLPDTTSSTAPATSSTTVAPPTTAPPPTVPPPTAASAPATTATTAHPPTSSTTATTPPSARPATAPTTRATPVTRPAPTTAPPPPTQPPPTEPPSTQPPTAPPTPVPTTPTTAPAPATGTTTVDSPVYTVAHGRETYGSLQLRLTFQGHQIVDAVALQSPNHAAKSLQINARALPVLRQEVLAAQSAQIDTVSGATSTSEAYAQAIQAVLDQVWK